MVRFWSIERIPLKRRFRRWSGCGARKIPLILNSSKTKSEMLRLRRLIGNQDPFISENGSAVFYPVGYFDDSVVTGPGLKVKIFGRKYDRIVRELAGLRARGRYDFVGFADLGVDGVIEMTGLSHDDAARAVQRHGSEPIEWRDTAERLAEFRQTLRAQGFRLVKGGRFYHVMGLFDKADGLTYLCRKYEMAFGNVSLLLHSAMHRTIERCCKQLITRQLLHTSGGICWRFRTIRRFTIPKKPGLPDGPRLWSRS
jgi:hypothetical protein